MDRMLHDDDWLYQAFLARDEALDGRVYIGVTSTGIFCKPSCRARKPKRENCQFYESKDAAMRAGFRPCKLCHPLGQSAAHDLADRIKDNAAKGERSMNEISKADRLSFAQEFGVSPADFARHYQLKQAIEALEAGGRVIDAQMSAGFSSAQGFRDAFAKFLGLKPSDFQPNARYQISWIETPIGAMIAICDDEALHMLEFTDRKALAPSLLALAKRVNYDLGFGQTAIHKELSQQLDAFFAGQRADFTINLSLHATGFRAQVWRALLTIPAGETRSYKALAEMIGQPNAFRAVANANARNQIAIVVPCHRVIAADGSLAGYAGGVWRKSKLLEIERLYR